MKHYLAFKGVSEDLKSAFIGGRLKRRYAIGKVMRSHPEMPFFLVTSYSQEDWFLRTGCDQFIKKVLLVRIPESHLTSWTPNTYYCFSDIKESGYKLTLAQLIENSGKKHKWRGATRLTVLEEVDKKQFNNVHEAMTHFEKIYNLSRIPV